MDDKISDQIKELTESYAGAAGPVEKLTKHMRAVRQHLSRTLGLEPELIRKKHIAQFVENTPDVILLKIRNISRAGLTQLKADLKD